VAQKNGRLEVERDYDWGLSLLSMSDPESEQFHNLMEFRRSLANESERGIALTCAAYIEDRLRVLLERTFANAPKVTLRIFGQTGPLATFSSKIDMAFLLGMATKNDHRGMHLIRKIRNSFAHYHKPMSFADPGLAAQCRELEKCIAPVSESENMRLVFINCSFRAIGNIEMGVLASKQKSVMKPGSEEIRDATSDMCDRLFTKAFENMSEVRKNRLMDPETATQEYELIGIEVLKRGRVILNEVFEEARASRSGRSLLLNQSESRDDSTD
jgi:DNA-binding MltR family transcriptional regulator